MTQQKKSTKPTPPSRLQKRYLALNPNDQIGVTTFFNLHNGAHYVYDNLSEDAQNYVNYCIRLSLNADKIEKEESAQGI